MYGQYDNTNNSKCRDDQDVDTQTNLLQPTALKKENEKNTFILVILQVH